MTGPDRPDPTRREQDPMLLVDSALAIAVGLLLAILLLAAFT